MIVNKFHNLLINLVALHPVVFYFAFSSREISLLLENFYNIFPFSLMQLHNRQGTVHGSNKLWLIECFATIDLRSWLVDSLPKPMSGVDIKKRGPLTPHATKHFSVQVASI